MKIFSCSRGAVERSRQRGLCLDSVVVRTPQPHSGAAMGGHTSHPGLYGESSLKLASAFTKSTPSTSTCH
jgi:hypothetical protein